MSVKKPVHLSDREDRDRGRKFPPFHAFVLVVFTVVFSVFGSWAGEKVKNWWDSPTGPIHSIRVDYPQNSNETKVSRISFVNHKSEVLPDHLCIDGSVICTHCFDGPQNIEGKIKSVIGVEMGLRHDKAPFIICPGYVLCLDSSRSVAFTIHCLDAQEKAPYRRDFRSFRVADVLLLDVDKKGGAEIITVFDNTEFFPCRITIHDDDGNRIGSCWHPGQLQLAGWSDFGEPTEPYKIILKGAYNPAKKEKGVYPPSVLIIEHNKHIVLNGFEITDVPYFLAVFHRLPVSKNEDDEPRPFKPATFLFDRMGNLVCDLRYKSRVYTFDIINGIVEGMTHSEERRGSERKKWEQQGYPPFQIISKLEQWAAYSCDLWKEREPVIEKALINRATK